MPLPHLDPELLKHATPEELAAVERILQTELDLASPADYGARVYPGFQTPPHIALLNRTLLALVEGRLLKPDGTPYRRLLVTLPPRHGKSVFCSQVTPAWYLTKYPDRRVILASYEADFAAEWGGKVRALIEAHPEYGVQVSKSSRAKDTWDLQDREGGMRTAGAGGPITGKGAHLLIIDDPIKNDADAASEVKRATIDNWYKGTAFTRLEANPPGVVVLFHTRWHDDDLAGRRLREEPDEWYVLNLPALATQDDPLGRAPGAPLWPERYDVADLTTIRETIGPYFWAALYQQAPQIDGGGIFRAATFRHFRTFTHEGHRYYRLPTGEGTYKDVPEARCWRFGTADLAVTKRNTSDYTVFALWAVTPDRDLLLLSLRRLRMEGADHEVEVERFLDAYKPRFLGVERAVHGIALIQRLLRRGLRVRELIPDKDKVTRAYGAAAFLEAGRVYFPSDADWLPDFTRELLLFPNAAHDDQVDVLSYAAVVMVQHEHAPPPPEIEEPTTYDDRVWRHVLRQGRKKKPQHPQLGALPW